MGQQRERVDGPNFIDYSSLFPTRPPPISPSLPPIHPLPDSTRPVPRHQALTHAIHPQHSHPHSPLHSLITKYLTPSTSLRHGWWVTAFFFIYFSLYFFDSPKIMSLRCSFPAKDISENGSRACCRLAVLISESGVSCFAAVLFAVLVLFLL